MKFRLDESKVIAGLEEVGDFFSHTIADHPFLQMKEIRKLVKRLPEGDVVYSAGVKPETAAIGCPNTHQAQHPLDYAIDNMESADAYMFILSPERDPQFKPLYLDIKADLDEFCERNGHDLTGDSTLVLFISSPGAVTPHHIDHQHTFIAQIKGTKTMSQWPAQNLELTTPEELEIFFSRVTRQLAVKEDFEPLRTLYELSPGQGAYIPWAAPHTVTNGDEVSISLSIIFNTTGSRKLENAYRANHLLRKCLHRTPTLPGESALKDNLKNQCFITYDSALKHLDLPIRAVKKTGRGVRKMARILRGSTPP